MWRKLFSGHALARLLASVCVGIPSNSVSSWWYSYVGCYFRSYALTRQWVDPTLEEMEIHYRLVRKINDGPL